VLTGEKWSVLFFWGCLKDNVYSSNPQMEGLKENIRREMSNIPAENLEKVNRNLFRQCVECLRVEGQHFQHLLWFVNKGKNFPSFQMLSACWVIGKIRVSSVLGGSPVAVKRERVKFINNHPVLNHIFYNNNNGKERYSIGHKICVSLRTLRCYVITSNKNCSSNCSPNFSAQACYK
jgi:hypothetical protein